MQRDVSVLEMIPVPQTQFAPLSEALCKVVADLNGECRELKAVDTYAMRVKLEENFPEMQTPSEEILLKVLGSLTREGKLLCTGGGYYVTHPDTFRQPPEKQMLMTNEEAIVKLHGNDEALHASAAHQTTSSDHLQMIRVQNNEDITYLGFTSAGEGKQSMLARILRRMKSNNRQHFSAQFPPPDALLCQSVATQTAAQKEPCGRKRGSCRHSLNRRQRTGEGVPLSRIPICPEFSSGHPKTSHGHKNSKRPPKSATKQVEIESHKASRPEDDEKWRAGDFPTSQLPVVQMSDKQQDIVIDNTTSLEVSPFKGNVSTTVVTEETTVSRGKVVTVTSITTSLSKNKDKTSDVGAPKRRLNSPTQNDTPS